jgi:glycosyltransferase involved in cell wall biosynthesis
MDEFPTLIVAAKERGLKVVSEIYILLSADRIVAEERRMFPGLERETPDVIQVFKEVLGGHVLLTRTDFAICPSEAVRDDLVRSFGFNCRNTAVVPYGVDDHWLNAKNSPIPGRILFAGTAELRKGIHYFALACDLLRGKGLSFDFRVAGNVTATISSHKLFRNLNFLGRISRAEMEREFAAADVLVLPSLAEGSASVTYEALAAGIPVITTPAAGSVVRDGLDGIIVPERDAKRLADAIRELAEDREKRTRCAASASARAKDFSWAHYGRRLVTCLESVTAESSPTSQSL